MPTLQQRRLLLGSASGLVTRGLVGYWDLGTSNLLRQSEALTTSPWTHSNCTVALSATLAPDGTATAWDIMPSSGSVVGVLVQQIDAGSTFNWRTIQFGAWLRASGNVALQIQNAGGTTTYQTLNTTLTGGWQFVQTSVARPVDSGGLRILIYSPTGLTAQVWHPQLNDGAALASYARTTDLLSVPDLSGHAAALSRGGTTPPARLAGGLVFDGSSGLLTGLPALGASYTVVNVNGAHVEAVDSSGGSYIDGAAQVGAVNYGLGTAGGYTGLCQYRLQYGLVLSPAEHRQLYRWLASGTVLGARLPATHIGLRSAWFNGTDETLRITLSPVNDGDGVEFYNQSITYTGLPSTGHTVRDPRILLINGIYWMIHTAIGFNTGNYFSLAKSTDFVNWTYVKDIAITNVASIYQTWSPIWFKDSDGSVYIDISLSTNGGTSYQVYLMQAADPANPDTTTWTNAVAITRGDVPANVIEAEIVKVGPTYYWWTKNETTKYIEVYSSSVLTGPYTAFGTGNWAGWGSGIEGPHLVNLGGHWRCYMDAYNANLGICYADSLDATFNTWTMPRPVVIDDHSFLPRNGHIIPW